MDIDSFEIRATKNDCKNLQRRHTNSAWHKLKMNNYYIPINFFKN